MNKMPKNKRYARPNGRGENDKYVDVMRYVATIFESLFHFLAIHFSDT